jgi:iron complex transport system substrate-binding protein
MAAPRTGEPHKIKGGMPRNNRQSRARIVSLAPSVTSILVGLGARSHLVGVSKWCADVAPVGRIPKVGDCWKLDVDDVMRLKPTILIGSVPFATESVSKLLALPVAFLALNPRTLGDIEGNVRTLARLVNRASAGEKLVAWMQSEFRRIGKRAKGSTRRKLRVYSEAWPNPRISSPPWVAELVALAGGEFVTSAGARVADDEVARANPELIVLAWTATGRRSDPSKALRNPAWQATAAVRNARVVVIRDELLNTPGPPLVKGARELLRAIRQARAERPDEKGGGVERRT